MPVHPAREVIGVLGFPFSKGQTYDGTEQAPHYLRDAGIIKNLQAQGNTVVDHGDVNLESLPVDEPNTDIRNPKSVGTANKKLSDAISRILKTNQSVLTLGGDHSMAIGSIHGHAQVEPNLVVVWVDAHADINTPLTSISRNIHGMPLAFLAKELQEYMPDMPEFDWCKPCISVRDIVYIGLRDVDPSEKVFIEKFGILAHYMEDVEKYGVKELIERSLSQIDPSGTRPIHVSFDVDGMDPALTPATGTPVPGGLSLKDCCYLAEEIAITGRLSVLDIAEVNPLLSSEEDRNLTMTNTVNVTTKFYGNRRKSITPPDYELPRPQ
ncbi:unnamed protein product [Candidula unifasciata]|uniref:Arginase n=1 Tax=Candidula unifasciata TaxID=100452 RepID=A0A8S3Z9E4_9EUPU|nr:unnamed protein product [Candidula unifasciata]